MNRFPQHGGWGRWPAARGGDGNSARPLARGGAVLGAGTDTTQLAMWDGRTLVLQRPPCARAASGGGGDCGPHAPPGSADGRTAAQLPRRRPSRPAGKTRRDIAHHPRRCRRTTSLLPLQPRSRQLPAAAERKKQIDPAFRADDRVTTQDRPIAALALSCEPAGPGHRPDPARRTSARSPLLAASLTNADCSLSIVAQGCGFHHR